MLRKPLLVAIAGVVLMAGTALAGTFGKVVSIGGAASDLAIDEARGVLYVANFTANRIEVMSLATNTIRTSINVAAQPGSLSLSPDGRWLLVAHFGNRVAPGTPNNSLTLIDLSANNAKQTFALGNPPLGVAFGIDNRALIVTTSEYILFDPIIGTTQLLDTISGVTAKTLPVPPANFPADITNASIAVSADGLQIYGMGNSSGTFTFRYNVATKTVSPGGVVLSSGTLGPRVVSMSQDGAQVMVGWLMIDKQGTFINDIPKRSNQFSVGTSVFDAKRNVVYAHIPETNTDAPILQVLDSDNLTVRDRLRLPENTTGKSLIDSAQSVMYSISDSGVLVLPVGSLNSTPRLTVSAQEMSFRGNFCDRRVATQTLTITDPGGGNTPFTIAASGAGVTVSPSSGVTPATVRVTVDPNTFQNKKGTTTVDLNITSSTGANVVAPVRLSINSKEPDQRGTFLSIPGKLVDIVADSARDRYYVLRQDNNTVLVFNGSNHTQIGTLRTYNVPTSLAVTNDNRYLLVGHNNSQTLAVFDLETLQAQPYIKTSAGAGNTVRSIAVSNNGILATTTDFQGNGHVIRVDLATRDSVQMPTLGVFENKIKPDSVAVTSANGSRVMVASPDGYTFLYDANVDTFTVSRKDFSELSGSYAASTFDQFVIGENMLNSSLVPIAKLESATGKSAGFAFIDQSGLRITAPDSSSAGIIQRVDIATASGIRPTRTVEAPLLETPIGPFTPSKFTRTLAPLQNRSAIVALTTSGLTVLPWTYDAAVSSPRISRVVSAADGVSSAAPGGLISIYGSQLSPTNLATKEIPIPTALGESCLTVNGSPVPMIFVSPTQINAQMPFQATGNVTMIVHTPGGVSDNFNLTVQPSAPSVFLSSVAGLGDDIPTLIRANNNLIVTPSNPVHRDDTLVVYLTGLGQVAPVVDNGMPAPSDPLASALTEPVVKIGGVSLPIDYAGLVPGQVGVYQINVHVPQSVPQGLSVPFTITQGTATHSFDVRVVQ